MSVFTAREKAKERVKMNDFQPRLEEMERVDAEKAALIEQQAAENKRQADEMERVDAENERQAAEIKRQAAEIKRQAAEIKRMIELLDQWNSTYVSATHRLILGKTTVQHSKQESGTYDSKLLLWARCTTAKSESFCEFKGGTRSKRR